MSSFRNTGFLALAIGALVGYAIYDGKVSEKAAIDKEKAEMLFHYNAGEVTLLRVQAPQSNVTIVKNEGKWSLVAPLNDIADQEHVQDLLNAINLEKGQRLEVKDPIHINWSEYSLEKPLAEIEMLMSDKSNLNIKVSSHAAFDGSYYLRIGDSLFLGGSNWARHADQTEGKLRGKKILRKGSGAVEINLVTRSKDLNENVKLVKVGDSWESENKKVKISTPKVDRVMSLLSEFKAMEFVASDVKSENLKSFALNTPSVDLRVKFAGGEGEAKSYTMSMGSLTLGSFFVTSSDFSGIAKVAQEDGEAFKLGLSDFRDGTFPFKFDVEKLAKVEVKADRIEKQFVKDESLWKELGDKKDAQFEPQKLEDLVRDVNLFESVEFFSPSQQTGNIKAELRFLDKDGKVLLHLKFGDEFNVKAGSKRGSQLTYVTSNLDNEVLAVPSATVNRLGLEKLVTKSEKK